MNLLIVLGLPRSGTSLVHKLVHEETGRKAIYLKDLDLEIPNSIKHFHKVKDLAEIHDIPGSVEDQKKWLEKRGDNWVVKSVELHQVSSYMDTFPESQYLICVRNAGCVMASVMEYFTTSGLRWEYSPTEAMKGLLKAAKAHTEKFRYIEVEDLPMWESAREPKKTFTSMDLDYLYDQLRGSVQRVDHTRIKECYTPERD